MTTGLLWFDDMKDTPLSVKVKVAAEYYQKKIGRRPELCLVNPDALIDHSMVEGVMVRAWRSILPNHLWIGCEERPVVETEAEA